MRKFFIAILNDDFNLLREAIEQDKLTIDQLNLRFTAADLLSTIEVLNEQRCFKNNRYDIVKHRLRRELPTDENPANIILSPFSLAFLLHSDTSHLLYLLSKGASVTNLGPEVSSHILEMSMLRTSEKLRFLDPHEMLFFPEPSEEPPISREPVNHSEQAIFTALPEISELPERAKLPEFPERTGSAGNQRKPKKPKSHEPEKPTELTCAVWRAGASLAPFRNCGGPMLYMLFWKLSAHFTDDDSRRRIARDLNPIENDPSCEDLIFGILTKRLPLIDDAIARGANVVAVLESPSLEFLHQYTDENSTINAVLLAINNEAVSEKVRAIRHNKSPIIMQQIEKQTLEKEYQALVQTFGADPKKLVGTILNVSKHHHISVDALSSCANPKTFMGGVICNKSGLFLKHVPFVKSDAANAILAEVQRRKKEEELKRQMDESARKKVTVSSEPTGSINSKHGFDSGPSRGSGMGL
jgi:hypothetical protein